MESLCFLSGVSHQIPHQTTIPTSYATHSWPLVFTISLISRPQTAAGRYPRKEEFAKDGAVFVTAAQIRNGHVFF
jgi:hypothetical protein